MIVLPEKYKIFDLTLFALGAVFFNHQLAALGLAAHVWANHHQRSPLIFIVPLLAIGALMSWAFAYLSGLLFLLFVGVRVTMGFDHFLYDRWVYRFSDPRVRETIGQDLRERFA